MRNNYLHVCTVFSTGKYSERVDHDILGTCPTRNEQTGERICKVCHESVKSVSGRNLGFNRAATESGERLYFCMAW